MKPFIKKYQYNYIKNCLHHLNNTFRVCVDINVIQATKSCMHDKILSLFTNLSEEEKELLDINKINDLLFIDKYLDDLNEYVCEMPSITKTQINKLFRKEKNLKLPDLNEQNSKNVYLGWIDKSIKKLFIVYNMNGKHMGMVCRVPNYSSNNTHMCALCNHVGTQSEVAFVTSICKTSTGGEGKYRTIGFDICLDSEKCNERIVSTENLEKFLKEVNNIK